MQNHVIPMIFNLNFQHLLIKKITEIFVEREEKADSHAWKIIGKVGSMNHLTHPSCLKQS